MVTVLPPVILRHRRGGFINSYSSHSPRSLPVKMADRLSQLQDAINQMAEHFTNSIGCIQQTAQPSPFPGFEKASSSPADPPTEDFGLLFAQLIARTAKDIDYLVDHLPNEESSVDLQLAALQKLEIENYQAARHLEQVVARGEHMLQQIQTALSDIARTQLEMQTLEKQQDMLL